MHAWQVQCTIPIAWNLAWDTPQEGVGGMAQILAFMVAPVGMAQLEVMIVDTNHLGQGLHHSLDSPDGGGCQKTGAIVDAM